MAQITGARAAEASFTEGQGSGIEKKLQNLNKSEKISK